MGRCEKPNLLDVSLGVTSLPNVHGRTNGLGLCVTTPPQYTCDASLCEAYRSGQLGQARPDKASQTSSVVLVSSLTMHGRTMRHGFIVC